MIELILGALAALAFIISRNYGRNKNLSVKGWQWVVTALGIAYVVFVLEVFFAFLSEGEPQAAVVTGTLMAVLAVIWFVVVARFFFGRAKPSNV